MANEFQGLLLSSYPDAGALLADVRDPSAVGAAVDAGTTGDRVFEYLWKALGDVSDADGAWEALARARRDLDAAMAAVEATMDATSRTEPRAG